MLYLTYISDDDDGTCTDANLPDGFEDHTNMGQAYQLFEEQLEFEDAYQKCKDLGAELASPKTKDEFEYIVHEFASG